MHLKKKTSKLSIFFIASFIFLLAIRTKSKYEKIKEHRFLTLFMMVLTLTLFSAYVVGDATTAPSIEFESLTPINNALTTNSSVELNVSIYGAADLSEFTWNWNGSNFTLYNDSLVLMLNFDNLTAVGDNATTAIDASRYSNNGTLFNGTIWNVTGKYGSAVQLDGVDDIVELYTAENSFDMRQNITITAWINPDVVGDYDMFLSKWDNINGEKSFYLATLANGSINFVYSADGTNGVNYPSRGSVTAGKWSFVAYTYNGTTQTLYLDGNYDTSRLKSYVVFNSPAAIRVGGIDDDDYSFDGKVDEVMIWNSTLTSGEIRQLYLSNLRKYDDDGNWAFYANESINQTTNHGTYTYFAHAQDISGNANKTDTRQILYGDWVSSSIEFDSLTPANATTTTNASVELNVSIYNAADLGAFIWDWNGTNYTMFNDSLILMLNFNNNTLIGENATNAVDTSKFSNNGTFGNATANNLARPNWTASGKYGQGVLFDGKDDYISIPDSNNMDLKSTWTISFWANIVGFGNAVNYVGVITKYDGTANSWELIENVGAWNDSIYFTGTFGGNWEGSVGTGHLQKNTWYHLVWTFNSSNATNCYQDGTLVSSVKHSGSLTPVNTVPITIGGGYDNTKLFNGSMDEVIIWNRSLSAGEIQQLYVSNLRKYEPDKWAFYVNETTDGINHTYSADVKDTVGNANGTDVNQIFYGAADAPNIAPSIPTINEPANNTNFTVQTFLINVTLTDADSGTLTTRIYAGNESDGANKLVFYNTTGVNDYNFTYNLTALPLSPSPDDGMVLLMHLDNITADGENATYAYDYSGNGNNGAIGVDGNSSSTARANWTASAKFGQALTFDGTDDVLIIPASSSLNASNIAISLWVKFNSASNYPMFLSRGNPGPYELSGNSATRQVRFCVRTSSLTCGYGNTVLNLGEFYFVTFTYDSSNYNLYVNGNKETITYETSIYTGAIQYNTGDSLNIGQRPKYEGSYSFNGTLDEIAMWNRSLTLQEVHNLYRLSYGKYYFKVNTSDDSLGNETDVRQVGIYACGSALTADMSLNSNTERCSDSGLTIAANNLFLDCQGYTITGSNTSDSNGINATGVTNLTIKNCIIKDFEDGIHFDAVVNNSLIENSTIYSMNETGEMTGIYFANSTVRDNRIYNTYAATTSNTINLGAAASNILINNTFYSKSSVTSTYVVLLGPQNIVSHNIVNGTWGNVGSAAGISITGSNNTLTNNTVYANSTGTAINIAAGATGQNNSLYSNTGISKWYGISITSGSKNNLTNNLATSHTSYGIFVNSDNNTLENNTAYSNASYGIFLEYGSEQTFARNNIANGSGGGISINAPNTLLIGNSGFGGNGSTGWEVYAANVISINNTGYSQDTIGILIDSTAGNFSSLNDVAYTKSTYTTYSGGAIYTKCSDCMFNGTNATSGGYGIYFNGGTNITIANAVIRGGVADINDDASTATSNITCINCTLSRNKIILNNTNSNITIAEYARVNVTNASGDSAVYLANVSLNDSFNTLKNSQLTGATGLTQWARLDTYFKNYTATTNYVNYTLLATALSHGDSTPSVNISQDKQYNIIMNRLPTTPVLITENNSNFTQEIFNLNWTNSTDADGVITYWLEVANSSGFEASSIALINASISEGSNTTGVNASLDQANDNYYWRVLATDGIANSSWSGIRRFSLVLDADGPIVVAAIPEDNMNIEQSSSEVSVAFNYTVYDNSTLSACELFLQGKMKDRVTTPLNGTSYEITLSFIPAYLEWYVKCNDTYNNIGYSATRHLQVVGAAGGGSVGGIAEEEKGAIETAKEEIAKVVESITEKVREIGWLNGKFLIYISFMAALILFYLSYNSIEKRFSWYLELGAMLLLLSMNALIRDKLGIDSISFIILLIASFLAAHSARVKNYWLLMPSSFLIILLAGKNYLDEILTKIGVMWLLLGLAAALTFELIRRKKYYYLALPTIIGIYAVKPDYLSILSSRMGLDNTIFLMIALGIALVLSFIVNRNKLNNLIAGVLVIMYAYKFEAVNEFGMRVIPAYPILGSAMIILLAYLITTYFSKSFVRS